MDLDQMRKDITSLIDDIKFHSDSLTPKHNLPIIQLNIILAKMHKMVEETTILKHYLEVSADFGSPDDTTAPPVQEKVENNTSNVTEEVVEKVQEEESSVVNNASIKDALGIYERYLYANELFNTSLEAFDEAINALDEFESADKANYYINEGLKKEFNWDDENEHVIAFRNLINRKFNAN